MRLGDGVVQRLDIPREQLIRTQTPHTYHLGDLIQAHRDAQAKGVRNTVASCTLLAELGVDDQHLVMGSEKNGLKLTKPEDVELFLALKQTDGLSWMK
jgi:2-C-methyl-D-erythritol 4-phosphate cytidylyltransferase